MISSIEVISEYSSAISARDCQKIKSLRSENCVLDLVARDAFGEELFDCGESLEFWDSWFKAFPEMDYQVSRTIAAEQVIITQWTFIGTNSGPLPALIFQKDQHPTGKTIKIRGVSVYDVNHDLIERETIYMDLGTLLVELGVTI